ncbi:tubulin-specific chaperone D [Paragonimus heterotremus]|uniref:Tubulin-specific chaperone D n=1 Tax=Paragonimus heterotremus TaxID=100268 RepID=A0A8J4SLD5_9TREM|nr:tubulin-specific chaperone D [Paragonimus heterotremus]
MTTDGEVQLEEEKSIIFNEFKHYDDVVSYIRSIPSVVKDSGEEELLEEELKRVFNFYQEQPHLLDPYLERLISECLTVVHTSVEKPKAFHFAFRVLYLMVKTRGYKSIIRLMPHTVDDVEPTLNLLVAQDINDLQTWQTRYVLLLWLSILTLIPFGLESLDSVDDVPIVERVLTQSKRYLSCDERIQEAASFLLARLVTRPDVVAVHLNDTITWGLQQLRAVDHTTSSGQNEICGILRTLSNICKIGRRTELLPLASSVLHAVLALPMDTTKGILIYRLVIKLIQRVGLLFCPPRITTWQYQRGSRSLADNLVSRMDMSNKTELMDDISMKKPVCAKNGSMCQLPSAIEVDENFDLIYADDVAEVIDRLLNALRSQYTVVRWSAAKGLGRMCNRLSSPMVSDVLTAVLSLCTRLEPFTAWHGACLTLAELGRRSLLLPSKLPEVIPVILRALFYDERSGDHSYGTNVRDAACYVCWAFARAYNARDFAPYVREVANALVLVSLFDREVNVRRAAAAAFQENVGRQGQFPHGIDIITTCDYFALRNRTNCFLELSVFVAQFEEYTTSMIDHLSNQLLGHWDISIRFLAARALNALSPFASEYMLHTVLPQLVKNSTEAGLYAKQGNIFGTAQLIFALKDIPIQPEILSGVKEIEPTLHSRNQLRGISGELLRKAVCHLIEHCSLAKLPFHSDPIVDLWRIFLDECIVHKEVEVQVRSFFFP